MTTDLQAILDRGVAEIIVKEELLDLLGSGRSLRLKQGFDPSRPDIHLGHAVGLRKLRQFQELGHQVVLIVGDWTAQIGDPSGESLTRPMLTHHEVRANAETYMKQFFKVVDREKTEVRWQSEWFGDFNLGDVFKLASRFTVAQLLARDDFNRRFTQNKPIAITELLYPLLQAYDSIAVQADVEFGGTDQKFNCLMGRELQSMMGQRPQQILLVPLLAGTDGIDKMSKSLGNYIGIDESPGQIYGKTMSIPDSLIIDYFTLLTDLYEKELLALRQDISEGRLNPMLAKKKLALLLTAQFQGEKAAGEAEKEFEIVFQRRKAPDKVEEFYLPSEVAKFIDTSSGSFSDSSAIDMADLLIAASLVSNRSEAKRLIAQGAIEVDEARVSDLKKDLRRIKDHSIIRVGKRKFLKIRFPAVFSKLRRS